MSLEYIDAEIKRAKAENPAELDTVLQTIWKDLTYKLETSYYTSSHHLHKERLLKGLEKLVIRVLFDGQKAKKMRVESNMTQTELAKMLGWKNMQEGQSRIAGYEIGNDRPDYCSHGFGKKETGKVRPGHRSSGLGKKYLIWLKKSGYNPYNI